MNLNPKQSSGIDADVPTSSTRRSSWFSKLSGRRDSGKPQEEAKDSTPATDAVSFTSHTPLVATKGERDDHAASTPHERSSFADLMEKTKGMTPEQVKEFLAKADKEHEEKFHETATVGRWQWKFQDKNEGKPRYGD